MAKPKVDTSFSFGANVRSKAKPNGKSRKAGKGTKSNAWTAYTTGKRR